MRRMSMSGRRARGGPPAGLPGSVVLFLVLVLSACGDSPTTTDPFGEPFEWKTTSVEAAGLDPAVLNEIADLAEMGGSDCLLVTRAGEIVDEYFWNGTGPGFEREAFSVTKSITATLVGIAQDQGHLDIDQPASDFITEWVDTPSEAVTIRNLLSNDSGRFQTDYSDYIELAVLQDDKSAYAIGLEQQHPIGTVWVYNNAAIQVLEEVLQRATDMDVAAFADTYLFDPLGMSSHIIHDAAGNALTFMGAQMSCRDMARFGLLYLQNGVWQGRQIVSASFVAEATMPSQDLFPGYGFLWWLGSGSFHASGLGGQFITVVPSEGLVVTRLGDPEQTFDRTAVRELIEHELVAD